MTPDPEDVAKLCRDLTRIHSHDLAEAAYWIVRHLLWNPEPNSLPQLIEAIDCQFWKESFFEKTGGPIRLGTPVELAWAEDPQGVCRRLWGLDEPAIRHDQDDIRTFVGTRYWDWRCQLDVGEDMSEIEGDLGFYFDIEDSPTRDSIWDFTDMLLTLHRYDLLPGDFDFT